MKQVKILNKPKTLTIIPVKVTTEFFFITSNQTSPVNGVKA